MVDVIKLKTGERDTAEGSDGPLGGKIKEIRSVLRMAYEAGRAKGREEARRELLGSLETTENIAAETAAETPKEEDSGES
ncbi:hypothetical protein CU048_14235 [Beijerinckiaceae bacterium]|nr:hypothetical protein CU048_14235 [Beijerinckiaceae bacterium]